MSVDWKRTIFICLGLGAFAFFYFAPPFDPAVDPQGNIFELSREAQMAIGLFLLAGIWWVFEVIPIGVTSIMIGVTQAAFFIRPAQEAFAAFADSSVLFILGSLMLGLAFTKSGLTNRIAFKMLTVVGQNPKKILLGTFVITAGLTHFMAHTAVAATMFPVLVIILKMYQDDVTEPSKFGQALFIGMAYTAGAGSLATMLGAARGPVAVSFFGEFTGNEVTFLEYSYAMAPFGWAMVFIIWLLMAFVIFKPEKNEIEGLKEKAAETYSKLGPLTAKEYFVMFLALSVITVLALQNFIPALAELNRAVPILIATILMFLTGLFTVEDLEKEVPWNIVLLFAGAMSMGIALWETGAAEWMAIKWLAMFDGAPWIVFILAIGFLVIVLTNFIMNVAAIAITLPVALVIAGYLGLNPHMILWVSLSAAGLPFLLLIGAAPNAIAYQSRQFTTMKFFMTGIPFTLIYLAVLVLFTVVIWPIMGINPLLN
ncbi:SLC13 family permease [Desulfofalx alkaliphila]|uniref:SLC13 family permease n=1 Tax=Desulfofalx alkaliphila TaxID=105483 RepID=UPI0004E1B88E|nr:SLC13 family permease [Desulfofalx alkaliphila]